MDCSLVIFLKEISTITSHDKLQDALDVSFGTQALIHTCVVHTCVLQLTVTVLCVETHVWTGACVAKPASSASCSWWWISTTYIFWCFVKLFQSSYFKKPWWNHMYMDLVEFWAADYNPLFWLKSESSRDKFLRFCRLDYSDKKVCDRFLFS